MVYVILEEYRDRHCGDGNGIIATYSSLKKAQHRMQEIFAKCEKEFKEKFDDDYTSDLQDTMFTLEHNNYDDYYEIKIIPQNVN